MIALDGEMVDGLEASFRHVIAAYLANCQGMGKEPDKPCSGHFTGRISTELHRPFGIWASGDGVNWNTFVESAIATH